MKENSGIISMFIMLLSLQSGVCGQSTMTDSMSVRNNYTLTNQNQTNIQKQQNDSSQQLLLMTTLGLPKLQLPETESQQRGQRKNFVAVLENNMETNRNYLLPMWNDLLTASLQNSKSTDGKIYLQTTTEDVLHLNKNIRSRHRRMTTILDLRNLERNDSSVEGPDHGHKVSDFMSKKDQYRLLRPDDVKPRHRQRRQLAIDHVRKTVVATKRRQHRQKTLPPVSDISSFELIDLEGPRMGKKSRQRNEKQQMPFRLKRRQRRRTSQCDPDLVDPLVAYVGQDIELQCRKCPPPRNSNDDDMQWRTLTRTSAVEERITVLMEYKRDYSIHYEDMTLRFRPIEEQHSGKYYCYQRGTYLSNYDLTVLPKPDFHLIVPNGEEPYPDDTEGDNLLMYTKWGEWSPCNHCNAPGERTRIGYCYAMTLTDQFPGGVPCRSGVVPYSEHRIFEDRKDEKIVESCNEQCPREEAGEQTKGGKRTYYLPFDAAKPTLPPFMSRKAIYVERFSNLTLGCPTLDFDKAVKWQNGSAILRVLDLHQNKLQSVNRNRMYIDALDVLHIHNISNADAAIYSCWQGNKNMGATKVIVVDPIMVDEGLKGRLLYSGFLFTGIIVFMISFGVFRNRDRVK